MVKAKILCDAVLPVDRAAVGDVQVAGLLGRVAVARLARRARHVLADGDEDVVVLLRHVRRHVGERVAVRPQDQLAENVWKLMLDRDPLHAADDPAVDEVADGLGLGRRERRRAAVRLVRRVAARAAAAAPPVVVVAVEVRADGREPWFGCRFLRQKRYEPPETSYSPPSGFTSKMIQIARVLTSLVIWVFDPYLSTNRCMIDERLLDRQVLARVVQPVVQDLGPSRTCTCRRSS